jgi:hypothetical protein
MRDPKKLGSNEQEDLAAFRFVEQTLNTTYLLVQHFLHMLHHVKNTD